MDNLLDQVDEYLAGRLQGEALDEFETELLSNQSLQEAVMLQSQLKEGLTEASASLTGASITANHREPHNTNFSEKLAAFFWRPQVAYGLSVVVAASLLLNLPDEQPDHLFIEDIVYIDQTRSAKPTTINLVAGRQFLLALEVNTRPAVNVALMDGEQPMFSSKSQPNEGGSINVLLPKLNAGQYQLDVNNNEINQTYFLIVRERGQ